MDKSIPAGAAMLLPFVYQTETGMPAPACYDVLYAHKQKGLKKPITQWTLDEVEADGPRRTRENGSSAAGAYQFMRDTLDKPGTLHDIEGEMGLTGKEIFSPNLQDRMAYHLLKRRGYQAFMDGKLTHIEFGKRLAQEWASFPVLAPMKGSSRWINRGQSYYAGDGINKSLVKPEQLETMLDAVLKAGNKIPQTQELIKKESLVLVILGILVAAGLGFLGWLSAIPCNLLNIFCGS